MKARLLIPLLLVAYGATSALVGRLQAPSLADGNPKPPLIGESALTLRPAPAGGWHPFNAVYAIMDRPRAEKGCQGCHIGPQPGFAFWFGADRQSVLRTLETGVNPNGDVLFPIPVEGGRVGILAVLLHGGFMPLNGERWEELDLAILDFWLMMYE